MKTPHGTARPAVDEATREADRRGRQSHTDRDAFALDQLAKGKDTETADILAAVVLATCHADQAKTVGRLLGLDPIKTLWAPPTGRPRSPAMPPAGRRRYVR